MAYIVPVHKPTSIRHALKLRLLDPNEDCLVVAKANQLDLYRWNGHGLVLQHSRPVFGRITMLAKLHPSSSETDHLFVGTDRMNYFTVSWHPGLRRLQTEKTFVDTADSGARRSQIEEKCLIDPTGTVMALELFEGVVTVLPIVAKLDRVGKRKGYELGNLGDPAPARIPELFVRSATFLHGAIKPKLALLWQDGHGKVHVRAKEISYTDGSSSEPPVAELIDTQTELSHVPDKNASHLLPVREPMRGLIILGDSTVTYLDDENNQTRSVDLDEPTIFVAWTDYDASRFLLADDYGRLWLLELQVDGEVFLSASVLLLGEISRASTLVMLDAGHVFVGSHQGDSQLVRIDVARRSLAVVQTLVNIAPILDFTVMDMGTQSGQGHNDGYSSGQARIVTGSGAFQNGSLRSVRSGVGLEEVGILGEIAGVRSLFALRSSRAASKVDTLLVSCVQESRIFRFADDGEVEEVESFAGMSTSQSTLTAGDVGDGQVLQVTETAVILADAAAGTVVAEWSPPPGQRITNAASSEEAVLVAVAGTRLVSLDVRSGLVVVAEKDFGRESQIACVTVPKASLLAGPTGSEAASIPVQARAIAVVGFWQRSTVAVVDLKDLDIIHTEMIGEEAGDSVPRALLMTQVLPDQPPSLFVATADGTVMNFAVDRLSHRLSGRQGVSLGTQEARLEALPRGRGLYNVFVTCEHPSLIYGSEARLVYAAVTGDAASCICPFDASAFPGSIVLAAGGELRIARVDDERRTHVRDLSIGETVRRMAHSSRWRAFALGTIERKLVDGRETTACYVKLVDEVGFDLIESWPLMDDELVEAVLRAELGGDDDEVAAGAQRMECFVVGTGFVGETEDDPMRGRILVFELSEGRRLKCVAEHRVKGACRCLATVDGRIVAGLTKTVVVYGLRHGSSGAATLEKLASHRTSTAPIDMAVTGRRIAVADLMKSLVVVEYARGQAGLPDSLTEVARHFQTTWATAVAHVAEDSFLESDAEGNLMVLHQNRNGVTADDRRRLETTSEMLLGEMVNRMQRIDAPQAAQAAEAVVVPRAFLATVEGSIYMFGSIAPSKQDLLMRLQTSMAKYVDGLGHMPFLKYRAFKNSVRELDEPFRFVDGDMIEGYLDCDGALQEEVARDVAVGAEELRLMIEGLRRLH